MAEGWARQLKADRVEAYSAGIAPHGLDGRAVKVMAEAGVEIAGQRSKHLDELKDVRFDYVVTLCGHANENCPVFPDRTPVIHVGFDDPPSLSASDASPEEALEPYRRVRDEIRAFVRTLPDALDSGRR